MKFGHLIAWGETAFTWIWHTSLYAGVLIVLVWFLQFVFKKQLTPRWHYAFGFLVLLRLLIPIVPPDLMIARIVSSSLQRTCLLRAAAQE